MIYANQYNDVNGCKCYRRQLMKQLHTLHAFQHGQDKLYKDNEQAANNTLCQHMNVCTSLIVNISRQIIMLMMTIKIIVLNLQTRINRNDVDEQ